MSLEKKDKSVSIKINYKIPEDIQTHFSDNFVVQHQKDHFILTFYEMIQPPILGSEEERLEQLSKIQQLDAKCISRIVVTPQKIEEIIKVLTENLENYKNKLSI